MKFKLTNNAIVWEVNAIRIEDAIVAVRQQANTNGDLVVLEPQNIDSSLLEDKDFAHMQEYLANEPDAQARVTALIDNKDVKSELTNKDSSDE